MNRQRIVVGELQNPIFDFDNSQLRKVETTLRSSFAGDELAFDTLFADTFAGEEYGLVSSEGYDLESSEGYDLVTSPQDVANDIPAETPVRYFIDNTLKGKFYTQQITRENRAFYLIDTVSAIGLLVTRPHYGGMYAGETFEEVAGEIINNVFTFSCSEDVANIPVYGWLPYSADARENLHQLLFAYGVMVFKDENGDVYFDFPDTTIKKIIDPDNIYIDGDESPVVPTERIIVTEHAFVALPTDIEYTLFDNTSGVIADHTLVVFNEAPVHDLAASASLTVHESGVNYAIVSGFGTLTGQKYTHAVQTYQEGTDGATLEFNEQTLVNQLNSINVTKRLHAYYGVTRIISEDLQISDEKAGDRVRTISPYGEQVDAYIKEMTITGLATTKARCDFLADYTLTPGGNNYKNAVLFTENGTFTVPNGVTLIRVICGQGGQGGQGGGGGFGAETHGGSSPSSTPGKGGNKGAGGLPGKVYAVNLEVTPGDTFAVTVGAAGIGGEGQEGVPYTGTSEGTLGTEGGHSTFGDITSEDGVIPAAGYIDILSGDDYALPGPAGFDGMAGGEYGAAKYGESWIDPDTGTEYLGGQGCAASNGYSAAGGGGAAYKAAGGAATAGSVAGSGADAGQQQAMHETLGSGGDGGNGGGGAGDGMAEWSSDLGTWVFWNPEQGHGGKGSDGLDGQPGFVRVLY